MLSSPHLGFFHTAPPALGCTPAALSRLEGTFTPHPPWVLAQGLAVKLTPQRIGRWVPSEAVSL